MAPEWVSFPKCGAAPPPRLASCFFLRTSNAVQVACGECDSAHIKGGPELSVQEMERSWKNQAFCGPRAWGPISPVPGVPGLSPASQGGPLLGFYWPIPWNCRQLRALRGDVGTGVCTSFKRTHFRILLISWARSHGNGPGTSALGSKQRRGEALTWSREGKDGGDCQHPPGKSKLGRMGRKYLQCVQNPPIPHGEKREKIHFVLLLKRKPSVKGH